MQERVECPKCGKGTIVQQHLDVFRCLNCDFKRDFSRSQDRDKNTGYFKTPNYSRNEVYTSSTGAGYTQAKVTKDDTDGGFMGFLLLILTITLFVL
ncbi:hypothetical protein [Limnoraphis robusta]|uniref:Replication restart DNA helicase PriA n=1 Tax=Limnoraphis robusta CCNP1315 TaxID=3110306 RepID=A0ABU5TUZ2_9CYAN|nr:hypothetical protein [Limnoraphis robusta]MEA5518717.1 hypothetical protein [Limnoraphis robusta CCNP1315]MEA5544962.1 hypothetical protein [Limnoraphis robusta CCNP1324]